MHFLRVNVTFYDAVNMNHDVITTPNPLPYTCTAKFMFNGVRNNKTQQFSWLVVLGFNATLTAKVISWRSVTHMCFLAFSHQY